MSNARETEAITKHEPSPAPPSSGDPPPRGQAAITAWLSRTASGDSSRPPPWKEGKRAHERARRTLLREIRRHLIRHGLRAGKPGRERRELNPQAGPPRDALYWGNRSEGLAHGSVRAHCPETPTVRLNPPAESPSDRAARSTRIRSECRGEPSGSGRIRRCVREAAAEP
jgi:hypothetical protein